MILSPEWPTRSMWLAMLRGMRSNETFEHEGMNRHGLSQGAGLGRAEPVTHIEHLKMRCGCGEECTGIVHLFHFLNISYSESESRSTT